MSEKPVIFISHSSKDGEIANVLKEEVEKNLNVEVFETSHFEAIEGGQEWFEVITQKLDEADALFVLVSPNSLNSTWVHWEIGYFYKRNSMENNDLRVFVGTIAGQAPFASISNKQVKSLNSHEELGFLLKTISKTFGQDTSIDDWDETIAKILKITPEHISDESAKEKLRDYLIHDYETKRWIDYGELDQKMKFALGASKGLIKEIIDEHQTDKNLRKAFQIIEEKNAGIRLKRTGRTRSGKIVKYTD